MASTGSNVPEMSVSELAFSVKRSLEESYGRVRVRGELSKVKIHTSGHLYSDLKDAESVINIVCWRGTLSKIPLKPEEGMEVVCTGKLTTYPARSNYQLVIENIELAGQGALLKMLEDRRKKLAAEGLFDQGRKKQLPFIPKTIGVVTSPTGAVIRDILHRLEDRFPRHVLVWPVKVQGEGADVEIAAAINGFSAMPENGVIPRPDLIIVARGGGSLEDLMPFNAENVVRAAADCTIPLISAVGHETDTTLIDFAADMRAPTPTAAAEMAVPERIALIERTHDFGARAHHAMRRLILEKKQNLATLTARLGDPTRLIDLKLQSLDHITDKLQHNLYRHIERARQSFLKTSARLTHPQQRIAMESQSLLFRSQRLAQIGTRLLQDPKRRLEEAGRLLETLSFERVLDRGFALVRDESGEIVSDSKNLVENQRVKITFSKTDVDAKILIKSKS